MKRVKTTNEWMLALESSTLIQHWRTVKGLTQKKLAEKIGTKQEAIARAENIKYLPSLPLLIKIAEAVGKNLEIRFK